MWVGGPAGKNPLDLVMDLLVMWFTLFFLFRNGDRLLSLAYRGKLEDGNHGLPTQRDGSGRSKHSIHSLASEFHRRVFLLDLRVPLWVFL